MLGIILALTSAVVWGSGDFMGGVATRRVSQYHTLALSAFSGLVLLALLALVRAEPWPSPPSMAWAALGGIAGAVGVGCLYRALASGHAASVAPTTAIIAAALPVIAGAALAGLPSLTQLAGFGVAIPGLWLVSRVGRRGRFNDAPGMAAHAHCRGGLWPVLCVYRAGGERAYILRRSLSPAA